LSAATCRTIWQCSSISPRPAAGPFRRAMRAGRMALAIVQACLFGTGPGTERGGIAIWAALYGTLPLCDDCGEHLNSTSTRGHHERQPGKRARDTGHAVASECAVE